MTSTMMTRVSQLWDQMETWNFREDIKDIKGILLMMITTMKMTMRWRTTTTRMIKLLKGISALEKKDMGFLRGHQGIGINDDDNNMEDNGNDINNDNKLQDQIETWGF